LLIISLQWLRKALRMRRMTGFTPLSRDAAETIALHGLGFLATDEDLMSAFLSGSGMAPADLREAVAKPVFLAGLLDFLLSDDDIARRFSEAAGLAPGEALAARAALPGGETTHWT
jgi:hypothetical protein